MGLGLEILEVVLLSRWLVLTAVIHVAYGVGILLQVLELFPHQYVSIAVLLLGLP